MNRISYHFSEVRLLLKKLYIVDVYLFPDIINRESIIAESPLDAINKLCLEFKKAIWFGVIGCRLIIEPRCCLHCLDRDEICTCILLKNSKCLGKVECTGTTCSWFKPESQTS